MRRDGQFYDARRAWAHRHGDVAPEGEESVPIMPGLDVLDRAGEVLSDELGTECHPVAGQVAGDGTEWESAWEFVPQALEAAGALRLQFTLDGTPAGKICEVRVQ
ncbi:hypothetical protein [Kocuria rosea]|uniref:hypothetical protein n=1 Tax=Kocuria rosea TaxID=1275 RepID=UPI0025B770D2|nr:hypothetical protein [Kocuria rosea]WJZ68408.1 hypothetical protein QR564_17680 [Kocuria rosea]